MIPDEPSTTLLESVIAHALELRDQGYADWLGRATQDCPESTDAVVEAITHTDLLAGMFGQAVVTTAAGATLGGRFRIGRRIGSGAMGVVHLAEDLKLIRPVAVKILHSGVTDRRQSIRRFLREAEAMASVQHASVVTIHDQGRMLDEAPFIVMEYVEGVPLSTLVEAADERASKGKPLNTAWLAEAYGLTLCGESNWVRIVATWIRDLAAGLSVVHQAGVLHRDIKPSNIIIRTDGRPVLLDFGLALLDSDSSLTRGHTSVGTPVYMPPEGLTRDSKRGPTSDVYSLAATLYHLVTLRPPYEGLPTEVLAAIATRDPEPAQRVRPGLPRDLQAIVEKGMHRTPHKRFGTALALESDLSAFLDFRAVEARPVSGFERVLRRSARSRMVRGAALALGLVAVLGLAFRLEGKRRARILERDFEIHQALPPAFTVVAPANRVFRYAKDRAWLGSLLDEGVELGASPVTLPLLRASFRLDHGSAVGAARDMQRVANAVDTPYARALAARYRDLPATADFKARVELADLPLPATTLDHFLDGYHALRAGQQDAARTALSRPGVDDIPYAVELHAALVPYHRIDIGERFTNALEAHERLIALEARQGGPTAASRNQVGYALGMLQRYREGFDAALDAVALSDRAYTVRINAGYLAMRLGLHGEARKHLQVAMDMRPNYAKPLGSYIWVLIAEGELDAALEALASAPLDPTPRNTRLVLQLELDIEVQRALALRSAGKKTEASTTLERASELLEKLGTDEHSATTVIHAALLADDQEAIYSGLTKLYLEDPGNTWLLQTLISHLPPDLSPAASVLTGSLLESLAAPQLRLIHD